jgi:hypothetical protein
MMHLGYFKLSRLGRRENLALLAFSALFTANIAVSNLSLAMVSVPFYQTMRMLCPIFTILIFRVWYGRTYSQMTYLSLVPLIVGAAMTTVGEMSFTDAGFLLTIFGVILAATKVRLIPLTRCSVHCTALDTDLFPRLLSPTDS